MSNTDILKKLYAACAIPDPKTCRSLMCDDFTFSSPMMKANSADEMIAGTQQMGCAERVVFKGGRLQSSECIYDSKAFGSMR